MAVKTADLDELDAVPPAAFVRTRDAVAERLRKAGRAREAAEVRRRRRPSVALWLVNRVARVDGAGVSRLIEAADRLRRASLHDRRAIADATAGHRAALQELMREAEQILVEAGLRPSPEVLRRVHATLSGAAADRRVQADLRRGRLPEEIEPGGFEVLGGTPAPRLRLVKPGRESRPVPGRKAGRDDALRRKAAERDRRAADRRARREAEAQRRQAAKREAEAARRRRAIDRATRTADRLREKLRQVEARIERERRGP